MAVDPLTPRELELWHGFKRASESVNLAVEKAILAASGLTGAEFGVLTRLVDLGDDGSMRQTDLARSMRWNKSRLSHQITRMAARDLLRRSTVDATTVMVIITPAGRRALEPALPAHAGAIRGHLIDKLTAAHRASLASVLAAMLTD